ncbi:MAG TPA: fluoride efflux transporter CrcB [Rhodothermales bacterium]|nr:fluoride efflux transporter CrcB [Rhodothermales bacterium]
MHVLFVALGGALGAVLRYGVGLLVLHRGQVSFPWATLLVNLTGSFLIGLIGPSLVRHDAARLLLAVGVLGGFTTFSTYSLDALTLLHAHRYTALAAYVLVSTLGGLGLCALGWRLAS